MHVIGSCDRRFRPVQEAFERNFAEHGEVGAAACLVVDGRPVVDIWGGLAGPATGRPWEADTLVDVFSVGKGLLAVCVARLVGEGRLDVDAPVARYWPEFAAAGKPDVTVRQLLSHQAGLPAVRRRLPPGAMYQWETMTAALAEQRPWWTPGEGHGYHTNTFGFLVGELVRRVTGSTVGGYFAEVVARPLGVDAHIGLPVAEHPRVATFLWPSPAPAEVEPAGLSEPELMEYNAYWNPAGFSGAGVVNTAAWRSAEIPSSNAHATARAVAWVYAAVGAGGTSSDGYVVAAADALTEAAREQVYGPDLVLHRPSRFGLGFQLTQSERPLGPNAGAFGHFGAGGSLGFCDPEAGVAFAYVMNEMGPRWQNPRNRALIDAVYRCL